MKKAVNKLTIETIQIVLEALRTRSMTHTARMFGITQPAVTLHIKRFEEAFKATLMRRVGNALVPTENAMRLQSFGRELARGIGAFEHYLERGVDRRKFIGFCDNMFSALMEFDADVLEFIRRYHVVVDHPSVIEDMFDSGELDIIIRPLHKGEADVELEVDIPFSWFGGDHNKHDIKESNVYHIPIILSAKKSIYSLKAIEYLDKYVDDYQIVAEISNHFLLQKLVNNGSGYTFGSEFLFNMISSNRSKMPCQLKKTLNVPYGAFYHKREISYAAVEDVFQRTTKALESQFGY